MKESLAVPVDPSTHPANAWAERMQQIAAFGSHECRSKDTVHSAICTITGTPDQLVLNLACTAKSEDHVSELMQYVNDTLLPQMENSLGIQFEVRNLQFAVAGKENIALPSQPLDVALHPQQDWLEQPFIAPSLTPTGGLDFGRGGTPSDLSIA